MAAAVTCTDHVVMVETAVLRAAAHLFIQGEQTIIQLQLQLLQLLPDWRTQRLKLFCLLPATSQTPIKDGRIQVSHNSFLSQFGEQSVDTWQVAIRGGSNHMNFKVDTEKQYFNTMIMQYQSDGLYLFFNIEKSLVRCKISTNFQLLLQLALVWT